MQKKVQNDKKFCQSRSISQESYIMWLSFMVHTCKVIIYPLVVFLFFFKILFFWVVSGVKVQKMVQNDKKFNVSVLVSQEPYIIWLLFMLHLSKMIISSRGFFIFSNFYYSGCQGGKKAKNCPKWQKIMSIALHISGTIHHMTVVYGTHLWNDNIFRCFFHFFKILIF